MFDDSHEAREEIKLLTLCLVQKGDEVLLGMKKNGFGHGRWNGFGGKVEGHDETILGAATRELTEESGIRGGEIDDMGRVEFRFREQPGQVREMHIFRVTEPVGEPIETDEMRPQWFKIDELPLQDMWAADVKWMPKVLEGKKVVGAFLYDNPESNQLLGESLEVEGEIKGEVQQEVRQGLKLR